MCYKKEINELEALIVEKRIMQLGEDNYLFESYE